MRGVLPPNRLISPTLGLTDDFLAGTARSYGTPLFVYHQCELARSYASLRGALLPETGILYSVKANPALDVVGAMNALGTGFEVCSRGEILSLLEAGSDPAKAVMCGPGKTPEEIEFAGFSGIGMIAAESRGELKRIEEAAQKLGTEYRVLLRINPGGGAGQQRMSGLTQFGMDPETAIIAIKEARGMERVNIAGFHFFMGTRMLDWRALDENARLALDTASYVVEKSGLTPETVDIGGGFGVPLYPGEDHLDIVQAGAAISRAIQAFRDKHPATRRVLVESGRYLAAPAGVMLTTVVDVKSLGGRIFAVTDGGIHAIGGRDAYFGSLATPMRVLGKDACEPVEVTVCGPLCTPADRLANRILIPLPEPGDVLALYNAGAYGPTASAGFFLSRGFPEEVMTDGKTSWPVKRPSWWGAMEKLWPRHNLRDGRLSPGV